MGLVFWLSMKVVKIRDDVWKFKGIASVYLIKSSKWILIDAGDAEDRDDFAREIGKVVALDKVDVVLLTHLHYDHFACVDLFPNAEVFASAREIEDFMKDAKGFGFYVGEEIDEVLRLKLKSLPEEIEGLEVVGVPGHTRGSVAFLDRERKLLFSGDTIFGGEMIGRADFPNSLPDEMDSSVRKLRRLVADGGLGLCPGHGYWEDSQNL